MEHLAEKFTGWVGSIQSIIVHTILFIGAFCLHFVGISFDRILLVLTTIVSLEAIYLAIFIQMTVNKHTQSLKEVERDVDEIAEDVDEIAEDVDEIAEDIEEIQDEVEELNEEESTEEQKVN
jgi:peptidoglycan hydrolase CwlO-like protein